MRPRWCSFPAKLIRKGIHNNAVMINQARARFSRGEEGDMGEEPWLVEGKIATKIHEISGPSFSYCPGAELGRPSTRRSTVKNLASSDLSARCGCSPTQPRSPNENGWISGRAALKFP